MTYRIESIEELEPVQKEGGTFFQVTFIQDVDDWLTGAFVTHDGDILPMLNSRDGNGFQPCASSDVFEQKTLPLIQEYLSKNELPKRTAS